MNVKPQSTKSEWQALVKEINDRQAEAAYKEILAAAQRQAPATTATKAARPAGSFWNGLTW